MVGAHFCICAPWALIFDILNGGKWMAEMIRVAVDAMGGDNAPGEIIRGAAEALRRQSRLDVTLVGQEEVIRKELSALPDLQQERLHIHPASEVIAMAEPPVQAITKKKDSSIVQGMMLVRHGECDAFVTAGSSGATLGGGQLLIGRIKGIERAPFAPVLPTKRGPVLLIDCGANVDARASELVQWGQMGSIYMESILGVRNPRVALANIGAEDDKGNALVKETMPLMKALTDIHFTGSVEARDIPYGGADVVVCDAFTGNMLLKMYEGTAHMLQEEISDAIRHGGPLALLGGLMVKPALKKTLTKFSVRTYGGAPMLGLNGLVVKAHGNADAVVFAHAVEQCVEWKDKRINDQFREKMKLVDRTVKKAQTTSAD